MVNVIFFHLVYFVLILNVGFLSDRVCVFALNCGKWRG